MAIEYKVDKPNKSENLNMLQRAETLLRSIGINDPEIDIIKKDLLYYYGGKSRYYHHLGHIYSFLSYFQNFKTKIQNPKVFELAIWFHDIIYVSTNKNNEIKSAEYILNHVKRHLSQENTEYLKSLIEYTAKHQPLDERSDSKYFLDFDLSILGAPPKIYKKYSKAIRKEYRIYPGPFYRNGRKKVLTHFLERKRLFFTDEIYDLLEQQARENIENEIACL